MTWVSGCGLFSLHFIHLLKQTVSKVDPLYDFNQIIMFPRCLIKLLATCTGQRKIKYSEHLDSSHSCLTALFWSTRLCSFTFKWKWTSSTPHTTMAAAEDSYDTAHAQSGCFSFSAVNVLFKKKKWRVKNQPGCSSVVRTSFWLTVSP